MPENKNLRQLYNSLLNDGSGFNVPWDQFQKDMQDENNLTQLHKSLLNDGSGFNVPLEKFKIDMGLTTNVDSSGMATVPTAQLDSALGTQTPMPDLGNPEDMLKPNQGKAARGLGENIKYGTIEMGRGMQYGIGDVMHQISDDKVKEDIFNYARENKIPLMSTNPADYDKVINEAKTKLNALNLEDQRLQNEIIKGAKFGTGGAKIPYVGKNQKQIEQLAGFIRAAETAKSMLSEGGADYLQQEVLKSVAEQTWGERQMESAGKVLSELPQAEGFWGKIGRTLPQVFGSAAGAVAYAFNPLAGKVLMEGNMAALTASQYGSTLYQIDKYAEETGTPIDQDTRYNVALATAAIEVMSEQLRIPGITAPMRKAISATAGKQFAKSAISNPATAQEVLSAFIGKDKNMLKVVADGALRFAKLANKQGGQEAMEEVVAQVGQDLVSYAYLKPEDRPGFVQIAKNATEAAVLAYTMGPLFGSINMWGTNKTVQDKRNRTGTVQIGKLADGSAVEILSVNPESGELSAIDTKGNIQTYKEDQVGDVYSFTKDNFEKFKETAKQGAEISKQDLADNELTLATQRIEQQAAEIVYQGSEEKYADMVYNITDNKGNNVFLIAGNPEFPESGKPLIVFNPQTGKRSMIAHTDVVEKSYITYDEFINVNIEKAKAEITAKYDAQFNSESAKGQYQVGDAVIVDGVQATVVSAADPSQGITVKAVRADGQEAIYTVSPAEYGKIQKVTDQTGLQSNAQITTGQPAQTTGNQNVTPQNAAQNNGQQLLPPIKLDEKTTLPVTAIVDGEYRIGDTFQSEKQAQTVAKKLGELKPRLAFEVIDQTADDDFAEAQYIIIARRKNPKTPVTQTQQTNEQNIQGQQVPAAEPIAEGQQAPGQEPIQAQGQQPAPEPTGVLEPQPVGQEQLAEKPAIATIGQKIEQVLTNESIKDEEAKVNTQPSDAQKEAGNYKKGHVTIQGFDISIENPKGSVRSGTDQNGNAWSVEMKNSYGYFRRTEGVDGDQIDVFIGNNPTSEKVFIVDQIDPGTGKFDEHKVMMGFDNAVQAKAAYFNNYSPGWSGMGAITEMPIEQFREWVKSDNTQNPVAYQSQKQAQAAKAKEQARLREQLDLSQGMNALEAAQLAIENQEVSEDDVRMMNHQQFVARFSSNPLEILFTLKSIPRYIPLDKVDAKEFAIYTNIGAVSAKSAERFGDKSFFTMGIAKAYFKKNGSTLDAIAQSASQSYDGTYDSITPDDVWQFILSYPNGAQTFEKQRNPDYYDLESRFVTVTGLNPTPKLFERADEILRTRSQEAVKIVDQEYVPDIELILGMSVEQYEALRAEAELYYANQLDNANQNNVNLQDEQQQEQQQKQGTGQPKVERGNGEPGPELIRAGVPSEESGVQGNKPVEPGEQNLSKEQGKEITDPQPDNSPEPKRPTGWGKKNTVFTESAAEKARQKLKDKLRNFNVGIDPEMMAAGMELAGYHIEAGARKFIDFAKAMIEDVGDGIRPYLKSFYEAMRWHPAFNGEGFDPQNIVSDIDVNNINTQQDVPDRSPDQPADRQDRENEISPSTIQTQLQWPEEDVPFKRAEAIADSPETGKLQRQVGYSPDYDNSITYSERQLTDRGYITFMGESLTGTTKIKSANDVAFLFKNLESAATENAFVVLHGKNGEYNVLYLGTGGTSSTVADVKQVFEAARQFNASAITFVHNHPSGQLVASNADLRVHNKLKILAQLSKIKVNPSIIINLDSGQYAEFSNTYTKVSDRTDVEGEIVPIKVHQFDRQILYKPSKDKPRVNSSRAIAEYLSKHKRGAVDKLHAIILGPDLAINRYLLLDQMDTNALASKLLTEVARHGECVVLASNSNTVEVDKLNKLLETAQIKILDYLQIKQDDDILNNYVSFADEGNLRESQSDYSSVHPFSKISIIRPEKDIRLTEDNQPNFIYALTKALGRRFDHYRYDYFKVGTTKIRVKGHTPNWENFKEDIEEDRSNAIINITVGDFNKHRNQTPKTTFEQFEDEYPNIPVIDIDVKEGQMLYDVLDELQTLIDMSLSRKTLPETSVTDNDDSFSQYDNDIRFRKKEPAPVVEEVYKVEQIAKQDEVRFRVVDALNSIENAGENMVLHNLYEDAIQKIDELGGLPMPSLAITRSDLPFNKFGNITLITNKDVLDNASVYTRYSWTPTVPVPEYIPVNKVLDKLHAKLAPYFRKFQDNIDDINYKAKKGKDRMFTELFDEPGVMAMFLDSKGIALNVEYYEPRTENPGIENKEFADYVMANFSEIFSSHMGDAIYKEFSDRYRQALDKHLANTNDDYIKQQYSRIYFAEDGQLGYGKAHSILNEVKKQASGYRQVNQYKSREVGQKLINDNKLQDEYIQWLDELLKPAFSAPYIKVKGKKQPYTIDNVLDYMLSQNERASQKTLTFGLAKAITASSKKLTTIDQIRQFARTLVSKEQETAYFNNEIKQLSEDYQNRITDFTEYDTWDALDASYKAIYDYLKSTTKPNTAKMVSALRKNGFKNVDSEVIDMAVELAHKAANAPTDYLEAKIQDKVSLSTFKYAVVPASTSQKTRDILQKHGVSVVEYDEQNELDRFEKVKQIAQTDNTIRFRKNFYSPTEKALESIKQEKGTVAQFKAMLLKNGAKQAEMDWMGWEDHFPDAGKMITKADIQKWIDQNKVELEEVVNAQENTYTDRVTIEPDEEGNYTILVDGRVEEEHIISLANANNIAERIAKDFEIDEDLTKYALYRTPGGENYQEWLLKLPASNVPRLPNNWKMEQIEEGIWEVNKGENSGPSIPIEADSEEDAIAQYFALYPNTVRKYEKKEYVSSHWDEPNVVLHIRTSEFTDKDGKKVLLIDEIQSDWQQEGRKKGFKNPNQKPIVESEKKRKQYIELLKEKYNTDNAGLEAVVNEEEMSELKRLLDQYNESLKTNVAPNMPFKQTDQIVGLAMRRMAQYAAEQGFDRIAWTTGEQQSQRYDLSKQVDNITTRKDEEGNYTVQGDKDGKDVFDKSGVSENELEGLVGKELASKIIEQHNTDTDWHTFNGLDLVVGGEGMKGFYDRIIPAWVNKNWKKYGVKVGITEIDVKPNLTDEGIDTDNGTLDNDTTGKYVQVHSIDVTSHLRTVAAQPQPLFKQQRFQQALKKVDDLRTMRKRAEELAQEYGVDIVVVNDRSKLPAFVRRRMDTAGVYPGVYDIKNNKAYVVLSEVKDMQDLEKTIAHEVVAHMGLRSLLGDKFDEVTDLVYAAMDTEDIDNISQEYGTEDAQIIADEYMARMAETGKTPSWFGRIVSEVRSLLRKIGFKVDFTDADIMYLLWQSRRNLLRQGTPMQRIKYRALEQQVIDNVKASADTRFRKAPKKDTSDLAPRMLNTKAEKFREFVQDEGLSGKVLLDKVRERGGKVPMLANFYEEQNRAQSAMMHRMTKFEVKFMEPLTNIVTDVMKKHNMELSDVQKYLKAKSSLQRNDVEEIKAISDNDLAPWGRIAVTEIIDEFESKVGNAQVKELWDKIKQANDFTLDELYRGNLLSRDAYDTMKKREYYVPLKSWDYSEKENPADFYDYAEQDRTAYQGLRKARGRVSEADDPLAYIQSQAHTAVLQSGRNSIAHHALMLARLNQDMQDLFTMRKVYVMEKGADANGNPIYVDVIKDGNEAYSISGYDTAGKPILVYEGEFGQMYQDKIISPVYNRSNTSRRSRYLAAQHEVEVYENGERYVVSFGDPAVANFINNKNKWQPEITLAMRNSIGRVSRWISANFTAKNPAFIPINWIRDLGYAVTAHAIRKDGQLKDFVAAYPKAFAAIHRYQAGTAKPETNATDDLYEKFKSFGGETGYIHLRDIDKLKRDLDREINRKMGANKGWDKVSQAKALKASGKLLEYMALMSENSARFATFISSVKAGRSYEQAATDAKNITVNFNRKGRSTGIWGSMFAFFNANVQGAHSLLHMAKHNKKRMGIAAGTFMATGFALTEMLRALGPEDDEGNPIYDRIPDWVKQTCIIIPIPGDDNYLTIPLPQGFRALWAMGVTASDMLHGDKTAGEGLWEMGEVIHQAFSPIAIDNTELQKGRFPLRPFIPSALIPVYDMVVNEDFTGRPIYKVPFTKDLEKYAPASELGAYNVNKIIKEATELINKAGGGTEERSASYTMGKDGKVKYSWQKDLLYNWNPSKIEHTLMYYLGGRGRFFNDIYKSVRDAADPEKEVKSYNIPVVKRLVMQPYDGDNWNNYFEIGQMVKDQKFFRNIAKANRDIETYKLMMSNTEMRKTEVIYDRYNESIKMLTEHINMETDADRKNKLKEKREELIKQCINKIETITNAKDK